MIFTKTLDNGIRVIVKEMKGLLSVTMGVLVGTGAAFETDEEDGISHFIEHMQFKGTEKRSAFELSDAFDALGAQVNAFTGKEMTCYYVKSTSDHAREAFGLLSELFLESVFPEEEMKREKKVVIEEIHMDEDSPEDLCLDLLSKAAFGNRTYGRNIMGPEENVARFTREDIFRYRSERYCPENIVVSFAGNIDIALAEELVLRYFGELPRTVFAQRDKQIEYLGESIFRKKSLEQAHFAIGFPSVCRDDPDFDAVTVMNAMLGGGMSSRLFKKVREELGLAYSVYSYSSNYQETGLLTVYAGVNPKSAEKAAVEIVSEIGEFIKNGFTEEEFKRGKEQLKSSTIFAQENTSSQMLLYGKNLLFKNEVYDFEKRIGDLAALESDRVYDVARRSFDFGKASVATVGNLKQGIKL